MITYISCRSKPGHGTPGLSATAPSPRTRLKELGIAWFCFVSAATATYNSPLTLLLWDYGIPVENSQEMRIIGIHTAMARSFSRWKAGERIRGCADLENWQPHPEVPVAPAFAFPACFDASCQRGTRWNPIRQRVNLR